jgi:hypothetical protein
MRAQTKVLGLQLMLKLGSFCSARACAAWVAAERRRGAVFEGPARLRLQARSRHLLLARAVRAVIELGVKGGETGSNELGMLQSRFEGRFGQLIR